MNKNEFIDKLSSDNLSFVDKIDVCQYYIDNYHVRIMGMLETAIHIKIIPETSSEQAVNAAFNSLKLRINEFRNN